MMTWPPLIIVLLRSVCPRVDQRRSRLSKVLVLPDTSTHGQIPRTRGVAQSGPAHILIVRPPDPGDYLSAPCTRAHDRWRARARPAGFAHGCCPASKAVGGRPIGRCIVQRPKAGLSSPTQGSGSANAVAHTAFEVKLTPATPLGGFGVQTQSTESRCRRSPAGH